jgi:hypothetical protein
MINLKELIDENGFILRYKISEIELEFVKNLIFTDVFDTLKKNNYNKQ